MRANTVSIGFRFAAFLLDRAARVDLVSVYIGTFCVDPDARREMTGLDLNKSRDDGFAFGDRVAAARVEMTPGGWIDGRWNITF